MDVLYYLIYNIFFYFMHLDVIQYYFGASDFNWLSQYLRWYWLIQSVIVKSPKYDFQTFGHCNSISGFYSTLTVFIIMKYDYLWEFTCENKKSFDNKIWVRPWYYLNNTSYISWIRVFLKNIFYVKNMHLEVDVHPNFSNTSVHNKPKDLLCHKSSILYYSILLSCSYFLLDTRSHMGY